MINVRLLELCHLQENAFYKFTKTQNGITDLKLLETTNVETEQFNNNPILINEIPNQNV